MSISNYFVRKWGHSGGRNRGAFGTQEFPGSGDGGREPSLPRSSLFSGSPASHLPRQHEATVRQEGGKVPPQPVASERAPHSPVEGGPPWR